MKRYRYYLDTLTSTQLNGQIRNLLGILRNNAEDKFVTDFDMRELELCKRRQRVISKKHHTRRDFFITRHYFEFELPRLMWD